MLSMVQSSLAFTSVPVVQHAAVRAPAVRMETVEDLKALSVKLNPAVGYFNPTTLAEMDFWGQGQEATIGFLRQSEIKHGRVAMFAFVGYCVGANGIHWPWACTLEGLSFADISAAGSPPEQWDALPTNAKLQILLFAGLFEWFGENKYCLEQSGMKHYMRGGKPGCYPELKKIGIPVPVPLNYFDPLGFSSNK